jgi:GNAT superfamily N-acetyltransferase
MVIDVRPATVFDDVAAVIGPKNPESSVCFCLSYRLGGAVRELRGPERAARVAELCALDPPPGVLAYDGDRPIGWAALHPRAQTTFARNRRIPHVDDTEVWSIWCFRVRPGHRKNGVMHHLLAGAVKIARDAGAPAVEGYPVDNRGERVDLTMAYTGTRALFERAGFRKAADTQSVLAGYPRVVMRKEWT